MTLLNIFSPFKENSDKLFCSSDENHLFDVFGYDEKQRIMHIGDLHSRALSLGGLIALKEITDKIPLYDSLEIVREASGKPKFLNSEAGYFSISHSGGLSVALYSKDAPVGVDIEKIRANRDIKGIANRFFSSGEREYLEKNGYETDAFYKIWTAKEAISKLEGGRLVDILKDIDIFKAFEKYKLTHFRLTYRNEIYIICVCGDDSIEIIKNNNDVKFIRG